MTEKKVSRENKKRTLESVSNKKKEKEITDLRIPLHYKRKKNFHKKFLKTHEMEKQT